jgi:hypothetical protein
MIELSRKARLFIAAARDGSARSILNESAPVCEGRALCRSAYGEKTTGYGAITPEPVHSSSDPLPFARLPRGRSAVELPIRRVGHGVESVSAGLAFTPWTLLR